MSAPAIAKRPWRAKSTRLARVAALAVTAAALACSDDPSGPAGPLGYPARIEPSVQWSGAEITIDWEYLRTDSTVTFVLSPASFWVLPLSVQHVSSSTRVLTLPITQGGGDVTVRAIVAAGDTVDLGQVHVAGWAGSEEFGPRPLEWEDMLCPAYPVPQAHPTGALRCQAGSVVIVQAERAAVTVLGPAGGLPTWPAGFGVSYRADVVVVPLGPDSVLMWDAAANVEAGRAAVSHGGDRVVELGAGRWVVLHDDELEILGPEGATSVPTVPTGRVLFSPGEDYAVFMPRPTSGGQGLVNAIVLRTGDGGIQSTLPSLLSQEGVFLAPHEILITGSAATSQRPVLRVDVRDGLVRQVGESMHAVATAMRLDAESQRLYVMASSNDNDYLLVLDSRTLQFLPATLLAREGGGCSGCLRDAFVVLPPAGDSLRVVVPGQVWRFGIVPP